MTQKEELKPVKQWQQRQHSAPNQHDLNSGILSAHCTTRNTVRQRQTVRPHSIDLSSL